MKILCIRLKNLASLEGINEIDFRKEPLYSAGIFAITGPTGSGKSTLLDALCIALYGRTPRFEQAKENNVKIQDVGKEIISQNDVRAILRDGASDGFAEVEFLGVDQQEYRVRWSVRRAKNDPNGRLQAAEYSITNLSTHQTLPISKKGEFDALIPQLIGLEYQQFTRSVLLAQGEFTAFLRASKDEKSSLLENLTGTEIYSKISKIVYTKYKEQEDELKKIRFFIEQIKLLGEEEITSFQQEIQRFQEEAKRLTQAQAEYRLQMDQYTLIEEHQKQVVHIEHELTLCTQNLEDNQANFETLALLDKLAPLRPSYQAEMNLIQQRDREEQKIQVAQLNVQNSTQVREQTKAELDQLETDQQAFNNKYEGLQIELQEAATLHTILSERLPILRSKQEDLSTLNHELSQINEEKNKCDLLLGSNDQELLKLHAILKQHAHVAPLFARKEQVVEWLEQTVAKDQRQSELKQGLIRTQEQLGNYKNKALENEKSLLAQQTKLHALKLELEKQEAAYESLQKLQIQDQLKVAYHQSNELNKTLQNAGILNQAFEELQLVQSKVEKEEQSLSDYARKGSELEDDLNARNIELSAIQALIKLIRQKVNAVILELRKDLNIGDPCAVCGSTEHPYRDHNPFVESELKEYLDQEADLIQKREEIQLEKIKTENLQLQAKQAMVDYQLRLSELTLFIEAMEISHPSFPAKDRSTITKFQGLVREEINALQVKIDENNRLLEEKSALEQELQALRTQYTQEQQILDNLKADHSENDKQVIKLEGELNIYLGELKILSNELISLESRLSEIFEDASWKEQFTTQRSKYLRDLKFAFEAWATASKEIERLSNEKVELQVQIKECSNKIASKQQEISTTSAALAQLDSEIKELQEKRSKLLGGTAYDEFKLALEQERKSIVDTLTEKKTQYIEYSTKLEIEGKNLADLNLHLSQLRAELEVQRDQTLKMLGELCSHEKIEVKYDELSTRFTLPLEWIQTQRKLLAQIKEKSASLKGQQSLLQEKISTLRVGLAADFDFASYQSIVESYQIQLEQANKELVQVEQILSMDRERKNEHSEQLIRIKQQEAVTEQWFQLSDLIGSADGKKFREIAQGYTLDVLLSYANQHLQVLSKRYWIDRVSSSLALQIIDRDMGDEVRTIYSLSGGESFLVSLALALGLSSMASQRLLIESLFIDEGFGTLDASTLSFALDALEGLQNQGRKVGIISHVPELNERISCKIQVMKMAHGKSFIEVVN